MTDKEELFSIVSQIPKGKVTTYGHLARISGIKNPRIVGNLLHQNTDPKVIPCHRVVNYKGDVAENYAFGGSQAQMKILMREGVRFSSGRVKLSKHTWN